MQITLKSKQVKEAKSFLSLVKSDYLTIGITKTEAYLICDTKELYTHVSLDVLSVNDLNDDYLFLRVPKKQFLSLWIEGILALSIEGDCLVIQFRDENDSLILKYKCSLQFDLASNYLERLDFLLNVQDFPQINLSEAKAILKTAKAINAPVKAGDNYIITSTKAFAIYQEYYGSAFACYPNTLNSLCNFTDVVYNKENALIYLGRDKCAILTKCISTQSIDLVDVCKKQPSECRCKMNTKNILYFISKIRIKDTGFFSINLKTKEASYSCDKDSYVLPIEMQEVQLAKRVKKKYNEQIAKASVFDIDALDSTDVNIANVQEVVSNKYQPPVINVPFDVVTKIFPQLLTVITLTVKQHCILLQSGNTNIIFARR